MKVAILGIDGYLGWPLSLRLKEKGHEVCGVDNLFRRNIIESVVPIDSVENRFKDKSFYQFNIEDVEKLKRFLEKEKPESIVHYGEIPSAPYSMISVKESIEVQRNNVLGTLGLLWAMRDTVPDAVLIKLGTMGEYGTPNRPLFEGEFPNDAFLEWQGRRWNLGGQQTSRDAGSFYHISKVQDTANIIGACKYWGLKSYDVMQGIIYGLYTKEIGDDPKLRTRFDIDESFGTIVNRFCAQAILGIPLTIYGTGGQTRGLIALEDAMQCMVRLIESSLKKGEYKVVNQVSGVHKMRVLADKVIKVAKELGIEAKSQNLENPRVEASEHDYEVISDNLPALGFKPIVTVEQEIRRMLEVLSEPNIKSRMEAQKHHILPKIKWMPK